MMKLNADVGEGFGVWSMGDDAALMPYIDMANVACGGHASDPLTMRQTVRLAKQCGVSVGAHPSYPDIAGFGRRPLSMPHSEAALHMLAQLGALATIASTEGVTIDYVKPHGALYNRMMDDIELMEELMTAIARSQFDIPLMILGTAEHQTYSKLADRLGVSLLFEAFADRRYTPDGRLQSRKIEASVYHDTQQILDQAEQIISQQQIVSSDGSRIKISADALCVHGDNQESIEIVKSLRALC
tara:strand:+ start:1743 stop:2471 length:729 start_codon:yes stop_codon:yes gene_type:complete